MVSMDINISLMAHVTTNLSPDWSFLLLLLYTQGSLQHCERVVYNKVLKQNPQPSLMNNEKPYKCYCDSCFDCFAALQQIKGAQGVESFDLLQSSKSIKATVTVATSMVLPDSTAFYPTLSHSTMVLPDSTAFYPTLSHSTMVLPDSTALYPTLSHFTMVLPDKGSTSCNDYRYWTEKAYYTGVLSGKKVCFNRAFTGAVRKLTPSMRHAVTPLNCRS